MPHRRFVIALVADAALMPPAAFLATRLAKLSNRDDAEIVIFSNAAEEMQKASAYGTPASFQFVDVAGLPSVNARISGATFLRLWIPELLGDEVERILYLDIDVYPENAGLFRLADLDMEGRSISAARDLYMAYGRTHTTAGGPPSKYLNAGVLLIDRRNYLAAKLRRRVMAEAVRTSDHDQGALNTVLRGEWQELSPAMNMTTPVYNSPVRKAFDPTIVHFLGPVKPWSGPRFAEDHPARREMEKYFATSPWPRYTAQHYDFSDAWNVLQARSRLPTTKAPLVPQRLFMPDQTDWDGVQDYLRTTAFADVTQGITTPRPPEG